MPRVSSRTTTGPNLHSERSLPPARTCYFRRVRCVTDILSSLAVEPRADCSGNFVFELIFCNSYHAILNDLAVLGSTASLFSIVNQFVQNILPAYESSTGPGEGEKRLRFGLDQFPGAEISTDAPSKMASNALSLVAILLCISSVAAQPGREQDYYLQRTAQEIEALVIRISRNPKDPEPYFERAKLYLGWFELHPRVVEHKGTIYSTDPGAKALDDIERAIKLDPHGEAFTLRGRYYETIFRHQNPANSSGKMVDWNEVERYYWQNDSFESAVADYHKGIRTAHSPKAKADAFHLLSWLYRSRADALSFYCVANYCPSKFVRAEKKTGLVFGDFERSIEFMKMYLGAGESKYGGASLIRDLYRDKARAAAVFEDRTEGLHTLTAGINALKGMAWEEESVCDLYILRGELYLKGGDFSSALGDYTYPLQKNYPNCFNIYEKRGDAYIATGQLDLAIKDYTKEILTSTAPSDRIFLKRGNAYLTAGEAAKAVDDLSHVLRFGSTCAEPHTLRARAYRQLKSNNLAEEDEKVARDYAINKGGCPTLKSEY